MNDDAKECLETIRRHIDLWFDYPPKAKDVEEVKREINRFAFMIEPKVGWTVSPPPKIDNPICAEPGCKAGRMDGLVNHAGAGFDPVWYCLNHVKFTTKPDEEGNQQPVHIPGLPELSLKTRLERATDMSKKWNKHLEEVIKEANQ